MPAGDQPLQHTAAFNGQVWGHHQPRGTITGRVTIGLAGWQDEPRRR